MQELGFKRRDCADQHGEDGERAPEARQRDASQDREKVGAIGFNVVGRQRHLRGDLEKDEQKKDRKYADDPAEARFQMRVLSFLGEIGGYVPAKIEENRDDHARRESVERAKRGGREPVPGESRDGLGARIPDYEDANQHENGEFEQGQHGLNARGGGDAERHQREHAKEP